jgi:hypothetical protein
MTSPDADPQITDPQPVRSAALADRVRVDLPRVRPEDMITSQEVDPPPDPTGGRDVDVDFVIRHAGW